MGYSERERAAAMNRKAIKDQVRAKGIESVMRVPKGALTPKMKRFAEAVAMGNTGADAYRLAYNTKGTPTTVGNHASQLKADDRIKNEIKRIERAQELAALHSAAGLHSIVISTLAEIATNPQEKGAVRVQAVRSIGQLVGVDAFRETKRVEHVKDSGEIRAQILDQLKSMMLGTSDAETVEANDLLAELAGDDPHPAPTPQDAECDSGAHVHTIPHEPPPHLSDALSGDTDPSDTPPSSLEMEQGGGDIFGEKVVK